jgi:hypothetical protein
MLGGGLGGGGLTTLGQLKSAFGVSIAARHIAVTAAGRVILRIDVLRYDRHLVHAVLLGNAAGKQQGQPRRLSKARDAHVPIIRLRQPEGAG